MKASGTSMAARMVEVSKFGLMVRFTKVIGKTRKPTEGVV